MMKLKGREIIIFKMLQVTWDGNREGGGINLAVFRKKEKF